MVESKVKSNKKKKVNFDEISNIIRQADRTTGTFLFKDASKRTTWKERLLSLTIPVNLLIFTTFFFSTLIVTNFKLINVIICTSILSLVIVYQTTMRKFGTNKDTLIRLLDWCESLYDIEKKFHALVQSYAESRILTVQRSIFKLLKWMKIIFYSDATTMIIGFAVIGLFLPESIQSKFSPPIAIYLPFVDQKTWIAFITTVMGQFIFIITLVHVAYLEFGVFFCIIFHINGVLDVIQDFIGKIKQEMLMKSKDVVKEGPSTSKATLQMEVLEDINQSITHATPFQAWIKIVTDMIFDVNSILTSCNELFSEFFVLYELATLGTFFITGLVFVVVREQYFFAIGISLTSLLLYMFCYINEMILDKFQKIKEMLYDLPWYDLDQKQKKSLMIMMKCDQIQTGFTAAGIHQLTVERFAIILKAGYSNLLILKDLVQQ